VIRFWVLWTATGLASCSSPSVVACLFALSVVRSGFRPNPVRAGRVSLGLCHVIFVGVEHSERGLKSKSFLL
jgi:hypothetical protein